MGKSLLNRIQNKDTETKIQGKSVTSDYSEIKNPVHQVTPATFKDKTRFISVKMFTVQITGKGSIR